LWPIRFSSSPLHSANWKNFRAKLRGDCRSRSRLCGKIPFLSDARRWLPSPTHGGFGLATIEWYIKYTVEFCLSLYSQLGIGRMCIGRRQRELFFGVVSYLISSISDSAKGTSGLPLILVIIPPTIMTRSNRRPSFKRTETIRYPMPVSGWDIKTFAHFLSKASMAAPRHPERVNKTGSRGIIVSYRSNAISNAPQLQSLYSCCSPSSLSASRTSA